ncbi:MAG: glycosyltransferase family 2 protein [Candidatus Kryptoniota bacterium]
MRKFAVVIPAYNAAVTIGQLIDELSKLTPSENIFVVDDGSTDGTAAVAKSRGVWVLKHNFRKGKGKSLSDGISKALELGFEIIVTMDSDLQHDPLDLPGMVEAIENFDIVVGKRALSISEMPIHRWISNQLTSRLISIRTGKQIEDSQCGYRVFRAEVFNNVNSKCVNYDYESDILLKAGLIGYSIGFVPIKTIYNDSRSSINVIDIFRFTRVFIKSFFYRGKRKIT